MKIVFLSIFLLISCASQKLKVDNFVLVHDAHFDERSLLALERSIGPKAHLVELPSRTKLGNAEEFYKKLSLNAYASEVCENVERLSGSIVLVGHGFGGAVINEAFGICPEKVTSFIYIGASIPFPGETPQSFFTLQDSEHYMKAVQDDEETGLADIVDWYNFIETYASDASEDQREYIKKIAKSEPLAPRSSRLRFDRSSYQSLPKLVLILGADKVTSPETQKRYALRLENSTVVVIDSNHLAPVTHTEDIGTVIKEFSR